MLSNEHAGWSCRHNFGMSSNLVLCAIGIGPGRGPRQLGHGGSGQNGLPALAPDPDRPEMTETARRMPRISAPKIAAPAGSWLAFAFALRTAAASMTALYIAFRLQLGEPKWAAMTVWIVAQNTRGMSLSKSQYRLGGTAVGAAAGVTLIACFAQERELFIIALASWVGLCTAVSAGLRNFKAYGAVLAGYTAAIIAVDASAKPDTVLDVAIARMLYISLGIAVEAIFTAILAPGAPLQQLQLELGAYLRQTADLCARMVRGEVDRVAFRRLFARAYDIDIAAEYAGAASKAVRSRFGHLRGATAAAMTQLALAQAWEMGSPAGPGNEAVAGDDLQASAAALIGKAAQGGGVNLEAVTALKRRIEIASITSAEGERSPDLSRLVVLDRLDRLLAAFHEAAVREALLSDPRAPLSRLRFDFHIDRAAAIENGLRTVLALTAGSTFWFMTAWSSGPGFLVILAVVCALFSTRQNAALSAFNFMWGGIAAVGASAVCVFALLPTISDFVPLTAILGTILTGTGLAMRNPRTAAPASSFAWLFLDLVNPQNGGRADEAQFLNGALALLIGIGVGIAAFIVVLPSDVDVRRRRLPIAVRRDLTRLVRRPGQWTSEQWLSRTGDRLTRHAALAGGEELHGAEEDQSEMLAALSTGLAVIALSSLIHQHPPLRRPLTLVLGRLRSGVMPSRSAAIHRVASHLFRKSRRSPELSRVTMRAAILVQEISDNIQVENLRPFQHENGRGKSGTASGNPAPATGSVESEPPHRSTDQPRS